MSDLSDKETKDTSFEPDIAYYKSLVAKAIIFKAVHKTARPLVSAFLANVAAYTVSLVSMSFGEKFDLERVWSRQGVSPQFIYQVEKWAKEVNDRLHETANGRMVSEWAKRPECVDAMFSRPFSEPVEKIPEVRGF